MSRRAVLVLLIVIAASSLVVMVGARRVAASTTELDEARARLAQARRDVAEMDALRGRAQRIAEIRAPEQDLIAEVRQAMLDAGLPVAQHFVSLTAGTDGPLADGGSASQTHRRQTMQWRLRRMTPDKLGALLVEWSTRQRVWTATSIELTRRRGARGSGDYDVSIELGAIYLSRS